MANIKTLKQTPAQAQTPARETAAERQQRQRDILVYGKSLAQALRARPERPVVGPITDISRRH